MDGLNGKLTESERSELVALARSLVPEGKIHSICLFGPRAAGYVGTASDHDLTIITKDLGPGSTCRLGAEPDRSSPMVIGEADLRKAAERPTRYEPVVSRFLNVYEPLLDQRFLRGVETAFKKRVMAQKLIEIQADYGELSSNLIMPHEYFLFDKLHKMALGDPGLVECYALIYGGGQRANNLETALQGFRDAAAALSSHGIVEVHNGSVRTLRGTRERKEALHQLQRLYPLSAREAMENASHSSASAAGIEQRSKPLPSLKENVGSMIELDRPNKLLRLDEGVVFDDPGKLIEEIAILYGFTGKFGHEEERKGGVINSSSQMKLFIDGREKIFVLKQFPELKNVKWVFLNIWSFAAKRFNMTPLSRLSREVEAVKLLHEIGVKTHRITGVVLDNRTLVSEYVPGEPLDRSIKEITAGRSTDTGNLEEYARALARMHKAGMVYGDTKPANALVGEGGIHLIDLEQAEQGGNQTWDLAEFLYYSAKDSRSDQGLQLMAESFLAAYVRENPDQEITKARNLRYIAPFLPFLTPKKIMVIRTALAKYS